MSRFSEIILLFRIFHTLGASFRVRSRPYPDIDTDARRSLGVLLVVPEPLHVAGRLVQVLVAVLALGGRHRGVPHDQRDIMYFLTLVERPLPEGAAALPELELYPEVLLHEALQRADSPVREIAPLLLQRREEGVLLLAGLLQPEPPGLEVPEQHRDPSGWTETHLATP